MFHELTFGGVQGVVIAAAGEGFALKEAAWSDLPEWMRTGIWPEADLLEDSKAFTICLGYERDDPSFVVQAETVSCRRRRCGHRWKVLAHFRECGELLIGTALEPIPGSRGCDAWEIVRHSGLGDVDVDLAAEGFGVEYGSAVRGSLAGTRVRRERGSWEWRRRADLLRHLMDLGVMPTADLLARLDSSSDLALNEMERVVWSARDRDGVVALLGRT